MKATHKTLALGGAYLIHGASLALAAPAAEPVQTHEPQAAIQSLDEIQMRIQEAAHLNVPRSCKWGHAAFEPVAVISESLTPEAQAIYSLMEQA